MDIGKVVNSSVFVRACATRRVTRIYGLGREARVRGDGVGGMEV